MDLGSGGFGFVSASDKAVALVDTLRCIDGEYASPADKSAESACYDHSQGMCRRSSAHVR
jgi:hypothetical protein